MRVLVLGASGMIGSTMLRILGDNANWEVFGSVRSASVARFFPQHLTKNLISNADVTDPDALLLLLQQVRPNVVINCAGLTKHLKGAEDPMAAIPINALMPHRLARLCELLGARLIHVSTDCVFTGSKGNYTEDDVPDAPDIYGRTKALGEVNYPHAITLRTSTIGHELQSAYGLLEWFLAQRGQCKGFTKAIFSGLPTVVFAQIVRDIVIPRPDLSGIFHVGGNPIAKSLLLQMIAEVYGKIIEIVPDNQLTIDRSLSAERFKLATGYEAPDWPHLIKTMHSCQFPEVQHHV